MVLVSNSAGVKRVFNDKSREPASDPVVFCTKQVVAILSSRFFAVVLSGIKLRLVCPPDDSENDGDENVAGEDKVLTTSGLLLPPARTLMPAPAPSEGLIMLKDVVWALDKLASGADVINSGFELKGSPAWGLLDNMSPPGPGGCRGLRSAGWG